MEQLISPSKQLPLELWYIIFDRLDIDFQAIEARPYHLRGQSKDIVKTLSTLVHEHILFPYSDVVFMRWLIPRMKWTVKNATEASLLFELGEMYGVSVSHVSIRIERPRFKLCTHTDPRLTLALSFRRGKIYAALSRVRNVISGRPGRNTVLLEY